uniref:Uncharacterized protein LOC114326169 n=1 Tax=Diabrotica virgifera virgifera TaxID=50390 RepID=A0A6P7F5V8_DIAVI
MMTMILEYTNKRAIEFTAAYNSKKETRRCGRFRESHEKVHNLWSNTNQSFTRPIYKASLSRDRFISILKHIRFDNLDTRAERRERDKLAPIREIADLFAQNCRQSYEPSAFGTNDEQLIDFRGRCPFLDGPYVYFSTFWILRATMLSFSGIRKIPNGTAK